MSLWTKSIERLALNPSSIQEGQEVYWMEETGSLESGPTGHFDVTGGVVLAIRPSGDLEVEVGPDEVKVIRQSWLVDPAKLEVEAKQERLAQEFPKRCSCGRTHLKHDGKSFRGALIHASGWWDELPLLGTRTDDFATFELRNCGCGSTLMAATQVHDLSAE